MRGMYFLLQKRNMRFIKDNTTLYRMIILLRLQMKNSNPNSQAHVALETIAKATINLHDRETTHDSVAISNPRHVEEVLEGQK